jgi:hypothetical protein
MAELDRRADRRVRRSCGTTPNTPAESWQRSIESADVGRLHRDLRNSSGDGQPRPQRDRPCSPLTLAAIAQKTKRPSARRQFNFPTYRHWMSRGALTSTRRAAARTSADTSGLPDATLLMVGEDRPSLCRLSPRVARTRSVARWSASRPIVRQPARKRGPEGRARPPSDPRHCDQDHGAEMGPDCPASDGSTRPDTAGAAPLTSTNDFARQSPVPFDRVLAGLLISGLGVQVPRGAHPCPGPPSPQTGGRRRFAASWASGTSFPDP